MPSKVDVDAMEMEEDSCPLCCEAFNASGSLQKVICSAENGCGKFSMCRLCVYRQAMQLERPFVVDDDTGDIVSLDPTVCPQCKRPGAFRDDRLPPLSDEVKAAVGAEARQRRDEATQRQREQAMRALNDAPWAKVEPALDPMDDGNEVISRAHHPRVRILNGDRDPEKFRIDSYAAEGEIFLFQGNTTVGVPDLLSTSSGVIYYEVEMNMEPTPPFLRHMLRQKLQFGFALANGMEVTEGYSDTGVGDNAKSWGFDGFTGTKINVDHFGDERMISKWGPRKVVGIAANLDKGMIAVSVDGNWEYVNGNGVKFEDESIKAGVYPCISCNQSGLECRFGPDPGPDFKYAKPPESLWDIWPKYEDLTWLGMSGEGRAAAIVLGYTKNSWDGDEDNPIEDKEWDDLTTEEKVAMRTLGYDSAIWAQLTTLWKNDISHDSDSSSIDEDDSSSDEEDGSPFLSMRWHQLPSDARSAAETLEYTQLTWDTDVKGPLDEKTWDELSSEQQQAATVLGYDKETWNEDSDDSSSSSDSSVSTDDGDNLLPFDHMSWDDLPGNAREAAEKLGHTVESWDENIKGPWDEKRWEELLSEQQFAAGVLGYDGAKWNNTIDFVHDLASMLFLGRPRQG